MYLKHRKKKDFWQDYNNKYSTLMWEEDYICFPLKRKKQGGYHHVYYSHLWLPFLRCLHAGRARSLNLWTLKLFLIRTVTIFTMFTPWAWKGSILALVTQNFDWMFRNLFQNIWPTVDKCCSRKCPLEITRSLITGTKLGEYFYINWNYIRMAILRRSNN